MRVFRSGEVEMHGLPSGSTEVIALVDGAAITEPFVCDAAPRLSKVKANTHRMKDWHGDRPVKHGTMHMRVSDIDLFIEQIGMTRIDKQFGHNPSRSDPSRTHSRPLSYAT